MKKEDFVQEVCELLDIPTFHVTVGSSVPSQFFNEIIEYFDLPMGGSMPERAKRIVEKAGLDWSSDYDSTQAPSGGGGTVTAKGLDAVHRAVAKLLEEKSNFGKPYLQQYSDQQPVHGNININLDTFDKDAGTLEHFKAQDELADWLKRQGIKPKSPGKSDPKFDLGFEFKNSRYLVEVKSITLNNEVDQVRYAIGQIYDYCHQMNAKPAILVTAKISDKTIISLLSELRIELLEPGYKSKNIEEIFNTN